MAIRPIYVISSYPARHITHDTQTVGGASYTKNLISHLLIAQPDFGITVFCEKLQSPLHTIPKPDFPKTTPDKQFCDDETYQENGATVHRLWKRNSIVSLLRLAYELRKNPPGVVFLSYEVHMFGGLFHNMFFLLTLPLVRLSNKKILIILHQVVQDMKEVEKNQLKATILTWCKDLLYRYILIVSQQVIVFEASLKHNLPGRNITVIPHAVEKVDMVAQDSAKKKLALDEHKKYILYFGYLSPYKGIDSLLRLWSHRGSLITVKDPQWELIIAGGPNPNHSNNKQYMDYVSGVSSQAKKIGVRVTGVIDEQEIPLYFSACDLVVLPYTAFFSSSGPLSIAFATEKPVLLSWPLEGYFQSEDFQSALQAVGLTKGDFLCTFDPNDFNNKIRQISQDHSRYVGFSKIMRERRSWEHIAQLYSTLINRYV